MAVGAAVPAPARRRAFRWAGGITLAARCKAPGPTAQPCGAACCPAGQAGVAVGCRLRKHEEGTGTTGQYAALPAQWCTRDCHLPRAAQAQAWVGPPPSRR